jgi:hypothetical protein
MVSVTRCTVYVPGIPAHEQLESLCKLSSDFGEHKYAHFSRNAQGDAFGPCHYQSFDEVRALQFVPLKIHEKSFRVLMKIQSGMVLTENKKMRCVPNCTYMIREGDKVIFENLSSHDFDKVVQNIYKKSGNYSPLSSLRRRSGTHAGTDTGTKEVA